jgi:hypothetical protein
MADKIGIDQVITYARLLGIKSPLNRSLALALGCSGVTPLEICSAYGVFAADGVRAEPMAVVRITESDGNKDGVIIENNTPVTKQVLSQQTAEIMNDIFRNVVVGRGGTGYNARRVPNAHGKTGTTSDDRDAWFIGYTPELVILKDKTVPEYGGGLCQVSSTAFRAALNSGFPILERSNHAYPVTYYYPIGTDATIYLPKPDFRFKNDSPGHLLIQTSVVGNTLKFEFYGTKTGRTVSFGPSADGSNAVDRVENIRPYLYNQNQKGKGSVDSLWYRFIYEEGRLAKTDKFVSHYDSPEKYPH